MRSPLRFAWATAMLALLAACAPMPQTVSPEDAAAKRFEPVAGQAVIYVYRLAFNYTPTMLNVNGRAVGNFEAGSYYRLVMPPGEQVITGGGEDGGNIRLNVPAGGIAYVVNNVAGQNMATVQSRFATVPAAQAQDDIRRCCTLVGGPAPG